MDKNEIRVKVNGGYLVAGRNSDPDYDGIYIVFETDDGDIVDVVLTECKTKMIRKRLMYIAMRMYIQRTLQRSIRLTMKRFTRQLMDSLEIGNLFGKRKAGKNMEELFTVKISDERFPALSECTKETNISLVIVQCGSDSVELTIESQEPDNNIESEYQEPTYIVWITDQGETIDKLVHPFDFENMEVREIIHTMIDIYMDECRNR